MPDSDRCFCLFCVDFGDFDVIRKEVLVTDVQEQERNVSNFDKKTMSHSSDTSIINSVFCMQSDEVYNPSGVFVTFKPC